MLAAFSVLLTLLVPQQPEPENLIPAQLTDAWKGDSSIWSIENGELVGRSTEPQRRSHYLFWKGEAGDFELRFEYRIDGGNSGVQYRSQELPGGEVAGYQADIEDGPNYTGILYESARRGIVATRGTSLRFHADGRREEGQSLGDAAELQRRLRANDWNSYRIVAIGNRLIHEINGVRMIDVIDDHPEHARASGTFAVQLHAGPPMEVRFRNMKLTRLPGADALARVGAWMPARGAAGAPEWIWWKEQAEQDQRVWFFHMFELEEPAVVAGGMFAADNHYKLHIDGRPHGEGHNWQSPSPVPAGMRLEPGWHGVALEAWNEGSQAGVIGRIDLVLDSGERRSIRTSQEWSCWLEQPEAWPPTPENLPNGFAKAAHSFGPTHAHSGPWGNVLAPKVAPAPETIEVAPGFVVERLYSAQLGEGSWVSMTFGENGDLFLSPQAGPVMKFDVSALLDGPALPAGPDAAPGAHVAGLQPPQPLPFPVRNAQGLEWAYDSLYVNVVAPADQDGGFHVIRDTDGDGKLDEHEHLVRFGPPTEHGVHGIRLAPDGSLYVINGNYVRPPTDLEGNSLLIDGPVTRTEEDVLLERHWDPRGHAHGIMAPAGVLYRTDKDGKQWQRIAIGTRNCYDIAVSQAGEVFTYDADMEWDLGMPWYRSPRVIHFLPGGEYGWRSGSAKWPQEYPDSLPPILETDLASPVGVELGEGSAFPAKYQQALFMGDWSWGRITLTMLEPDGATYAGTYEEFLQGRGLTVTDLEFGPDGNLWFTIGGRGTQSGLYRVRPLEPNPSPTALATPPFAAARDAAARGEITPESKQSRELRYLQRLAMERKGAKHLVDVGKLQALGYLESEFGGLTTLLALARVDASQIDEGALAQGLAAGMPDSARPLAASEVHWLALRVAMHLAEREASIDYARTLAAGFPFGDAVFDREAARLMVACDAVDPAKLVPFLDRKYSQETRIHYAAMLAEIAHRFELAHAMALLMWEVQESRLQGGLSAGGFVNAIGKRAREKMQPEVREQAENAVALAAVELPPAFVIEGRDFVADWTMADLTAALNGLPADAGDVERGHHLFQQALCFQCHRIAGEGGSMGPDLTAAGRRYSRNDLLEAILEPAKNTTDQYKLIAMPEGLLDKFTAEEIADLMAFVEQRR